MLTLALGAAESASNLGKGATGAQTRYTLVCFLARLLRSTTAPAPPDREGQDRGCPGQGLPTKMSPRALRRLSQLHEAKSLGRDKELARRLQKGAAEPSPQSYKQPPTSPPGGRFTGKAARPAPNDGTSPGRTADAFRAADALDPVSYTHLTLPTKA